MSPDELNEIVLLAECVIDGEPESRERWLKEGPKIVIELARALEHNQYHQAVRAERLRAWVLEEVKPLSEEAAHRYFSIVANGVADSSEQPTYAQRMNLLTHAMERMRDRARAMHRRAQRSEGAEERTERLRRNFQEELHRALVRADERAQFWKDLYNAAVKQIEDLGVDSTIDGDPNHRTGKLDELIRRLVKYLEEGRECSKSGQNAT